ncbi:hypothetical protein [Mycolicibacterium bacteremicum]|nr:hypothetical protein [Mycolicibacterium bacteremicum]MCV7431866.1 hypothetical protein [Mycolicibacterium bacteremicum]
MAAGRVTRGQLRHRYRPILRGVHVPRDHVPTLRQRIDAVLLAVPGGVIGGVAAAALHGARWVDDDAPIEVFARCRQQAGLVIRKDVLDAAEIESVSGVPVTTRERTAVDLARRLPRNAAVARLDALMREAPFRIDDVELLAKAHPGARGLRRMRLALPLVDGGAESPKETWLRLLFIDAGLPRPRTQFVVRTEGGRYVRRLDMVWENYKVGAEYDGVQHLAERSVYARDVWVGRELQRLQWHVVRVIKEDHGDDIIRHARAALESRGWSGSARE